jgi:hypothetical protein
MTYGTKTKNLQRLASLLPGFSVNTATPRASSMLTNTEVKTKTNVIGKDFRKRSSLKINL